MKNGKYGVWASNRNWPTQNGLNAVMEEYDVEALANDCDAAGVNWVVFNVGQSCGYYSSPNSKYASILSNAGIPSREPTRDLLSDDLNKVLS